MVWITLNGKLGSPDGEDPGGGAASSEAAVFGTEDVFDAPRGGLTFPLLHPQRTLVYHIVSLRPAAGSDKEVASGKRIGSRTLGQACGRIRQTVGNADVLAHIVRRVGHQTVTEDKASVAVNLRCQIRKHVLVHHSGDGSVLDGRTGIEQ